MEKYRTGKYTSKQHFYSMKVLFSAYDNVYVCMFTNFHTHNNNQYFFYLSSDRAFEKIFWNKPDKNWSLSFCVKSWY